jgi:hypothetical protein
MTRLRAAALVLVAALSVATPTSLVGGSVPTGSNESAQEFLNLLAKAMRKGDTGFMLRRLHPAVIERYGKPLCRGFLLTLEDKTAEFVVEEVRRAEPYEYASDGETATIPKTRTIIVQRTADGTKATEMLHLTKRGQRFAWFTACQPSGAEAVAAALAPYTGTYEGTWIDALFQVQGEITVRAAIDKTSNTLHVSLAFTGPLFGATAPVSELLAPVSLDIATFGTPVTGTSTIFGPYTVAYTATGGVAIAMPACPPGACALTGTLTPSAFSGTVSVVLVDGSTSQGSVELKKRPT